MSRATHLALLSLAVFLMLFTGTVGKPGMPPTLKADEPAYLLMAQSLVEDRDLLVEAEDFPRLFDSYPYLPTENLILMSDDGWQTIYYGKPFIYSFLAAPLVAVFGANGLVAFNALLFVAMIWCGAWYLMRWNSEAMALLYSALFFISSPAWAYVFWLHPEVFNMASVMISIVLVFGRFARPKWEHLAVPASGVALALGIYNKPMLLAFSLPLVYSVWRRQGLRRAGVWLLALVAGSLALAGGSTILTGHPSSYLGVARGGVTVESPEAVQKIIEALPETLAKASKTANSWSWVFRMPQTSLAEVRQSLGYFLWGRHTGLLLYLPFAVVSLVLFLVQRRYGLERWLLLLSMAVITLFFICVIPFNWHGGGGFVGNRYFIMCYPAFLFLVTKVSPAWLTIPGAAAGGLFLGSILFTPFGAAVPLPTLQAHARGPQFERFPLELSLRQTIPGYSVFAYSHLTLMAPKDRLMPHRKRGGLPWVQARVPVNALVLTDRLIQGLFFEITTFSSDNQVEVDFAGNRETIEFRADDGRRSKSRVVELRPLQDPKLHHEKGGVVYVYDLSIHASSGLRIVDTKMPSEVFFAGAQLNFLGRRDQITRPEHYRVEWLAAQAPREVAPGESFEVSVRLKNSSQSKFASEGPIPVNISSRWVRPDGTDSGRAGARTRFAEPLEPGAELATEILVEAPDAEGEFQLELDLVRENVAWFSDIEGPSKTLAITVRQQE